MRSVELQFTFDFVWNANYICPGCNFDSACEMINLLIVTTYKHATETTTATLLLSKVQTVDADIYGLTFVIKNQIDLLLIGVNGVNVLLDFLDSLLRLILRIFNC